MWTLRSLKPRTTLSVRPKRGTSGVSFYFKFNRICGFWCPCVWDFFPNFLGGFLFSEILAATSAIRPRADVAYCIHALARRLAKTHNWTVRNYCLLGFNLHISPNFVGLRFVNMEMNCGLLLTVVYFCYCGFFFIINYSYGSDQL